MTGLLAGCGSAPQLLAIDQACATDKDGSAVAIEGVVNADSAINCSNYGGDYRCGVDGLAGPHRHTVAPQCTHEGDEVSRQPVRDDGHQFSRSSAAAFT
ncbi:MAG: hypothetical protein QOH17_3744, partial [Pseudonocardiales bacterium]|nr:hypothetical protein [Pseudonocardiales bacterium]